MSNAQLFSTVAREYANFRPGYPPELFAWLARISPARDVVWDCGCGSGQASVALAEHFDVVQATDVAPEQIAAARRTRACDIPWRPRSARALPSVQSTWSPSHRRCTGSMSKAFYAEAARVARRGAATRRCGPTRDRSSWTWNSIAASSRFYSDVVGPYWPPERRHVEAGYRTLPFPFEEIAAPEFGLELEWNLEQVAGYVSSWSATARYRPGAGRGSGAAAAAIAGSRLAGQRRRGRGPHAARRARRQAA